MTRPPSRSPSLSLRPGLTAVRRDDGHLQVGIDPPLRVVLRDQPDVRRVLDALRRGKSPAPGPTTTAVLRALDAAGALVVRAEAATAGLPAATVDAGWAWHGAEAGHRLDARRSAQVSLDAPPEAGAAVRRLLHDAGLRVVDSGLGDVHLLLDHGVVARGRVDECMRTGTPHLVVAGESGGYAVGPFVVPGASPCLRCDDARRAEVDPRRPLVVEQLARVAAPAGDPVALALAVAWAVRDVATWVEGDRPATWGGSVVLGPSGPAETRSITRHPHCGCAWADFLHASVG